jgi:hypothetical protein
VPRLPTLHAWATGSSASRWFEVFNRGEQPVPFTVQSREPWLRLSAAEGVAGPDDVRIEVSVDWSTAPYGNAVGRIEIRPQGRDGLLRIDVPIIRPTPEVAAQASGAFVELDRHLAIEAPHFSRSISRDGIEWLLLENHGRTLGGVTVFPVTAASIDAPGGDSPRLEYPIWMESSGDARLRLVVSPTQAYVPGRGLRLAVSVGDEAPRVIDLLADRSGGAWDRMVSDGVNQVTTRLRIPAPGHHTLKVWMVDPGVVVQRLDLDFGGLKPTYLGPRESPQAPR